MRMIIMRKTDPCPTCGQQKSEESNQCFGCFTLRPFGIKNEHPLYECYRSMLRRCYDQNDNQYKDYGGRGITVCDQWRNDFWAFVSDMGPKPSPSHSLDRTDNNGNYCPDNCDWRSPKEQANNRRNTIRLEVFGENKTLSEWADDPRCLDSYNTLWTRFYKLKWSPEQVIVGKRKTR